MAHEPEPMNESFTCSSPHADDASSARWTHDRVFNAPLVYDVAFAWNIEPELEQLLRILQTSPGGDARRVLVPACGTGRFARALARLGHHVTAIDINAAMIDYARREYAGPPINYRVGDITATIEAPDDSFDVGFLMCNSFRYLLSDDGAARHLAEVRRTLRPGGVYVIDVGLGEGPEHVGGIAEWTTSARGYRARARWTTMQATPPIGIDLVEIELVSVSDGRREHIVEHQPQRLWTYADLVRLAQAAGLDITAVRTRGGRLVAAPSGPLRAHIEMRRPA